MMNAPVKMRKIVLLLGDIGVLYLALAATLVARYREIDPYLWGLHWPIFTLVFLLWLMIFYANGLYDLEVARNNLGFVRKFSISLAVAFAVAIGVFYLFPVVIAPRRNLFLDLAVVAALLPLWRYAANHLFRGAVLGSRVLCIGGTPEMIKLARILATSPQLGHTVTALVLPERREHNLPHNLHIVVGLEQVGQILAEQSVGLVVLGPEVASNQELTSTLYQNLARNLATVDMVSLYEEITRRIPLSIISEAWFLYNIRETEKRTYDAAKRVLDLWGSIALGAVFLITLPIFALIITADSYGPIFFTQKRVGRHGNTFTMWKYRTMMRHAEQTGPQFTTQGDKRVTRVGKYLRLLRLDELPQAINILRGDMSFVGPRPERPEFVSGLTGELPFYPVRHLIKPGLTGWAQLQNPYYATLSEQLEKLQYDLYYVKNRSLVLDVAILIKTANVVLRGRGR